MTLMVCKRKRSKIGKKTKWWKLKKGECCEDFRQKLRQALGGQVVLPDDWETTAEVIRVTGRKVLGVSSGRRKEDKETWSWNEGVHDSIQRKRLAKKKWDMDRTKENRQEYKELQRRVKREVSKAKQDAYDELYTRLDTREGQKDLYRLARQRDRDGKDVQQVRVIKDRDGRVLTSVVLKEEFGRNVLEVKRVSDRVMSLKLEIEGVMLNVVSGYAPQVGCELEEKERFWSELDEVIESILTGERVVIVADFNGHVGEGNTGDEEVMGKFGVKERNLEGQMVVDFALRILDMAVVNTYFQKREEHRVTYKSGGRSTQVDYILCRRGSLKEISDCKVVVGESVARQHRMVVFRMTLMVCKRKRSKIEIQKKTKWWKLKKEECCEDFRQKLRQALGGKVVLPDDWETTAEVIRVAGRKVLGVSSGRKKEDKETWWLNEGVQDSVQRKRLAKKKWDMDRTKENRQENKELQQAGGV
ncbi:hypothetical protein PDJAM_G00257940 [Pangasius djambal]|uniref:Uncharacterized protein n=1 Tax=Pangasius djambal TaxID=1691987 RepID=A0ACC5YL09_9TELE|nr:hypothetical protein [Pangasius djambal]